MMNLEKTILQLLERALDMVESKLLRSGGKPIQIWFLLAGYGMFRTIHERKQIDLHFQTIVDKLTHLTYKILGREKRLDGFRDQLGVSIPSSPTNRISNEVIH
jgi:hypothetical protein